MLVILKAAGNLLSFILKLTQVFNNTRAAARLAGNAGVTAMQNEPVMYIDFKFRWNDLDKLLFHLVDVFAHGKLCAV